MGALIWLYVLIWSTIGCVLGAALAPFRHRMSRAVAPGRRRSSCLPSEPNPRATPAGRVCGLCELAGYFRCLR